MVTCYISLSLYLLAIWYIQYCKWYTPETQRLQVRKAQNCAVCCVFYIFSVLMEDTEVGGHSVGVWYVPMFTTWNITPMGITTVSLWLQLYWFRTVKPNSRWFTAAWYRCLSVYIQYLCKWLHVGVCVYTTEVHYALILMLLTYYCLVCFFCSHTALASLFSLFVFWNLSAGCLLQMSQIKLSSLSVLWNVPSSDAGCFLHSSTLGSGRPEALVFG